MFELNALVSAPILVGCARPTAAALLSSARSADRTAENAPGAQRKTKMFPFSARANYWFNVSNNLAGKDTTTANRRNFGLEQHRFFIVSYALLVVWFIVK